MYAFFNTSWRGIFSQEIYKFLCLYIFLERGTRLAGGILITLQGGKDTNRARTLNLSLLCAQGRRGGRGGGGGHS